MARKIFVVLDKKTGQETLVESNTKNRAQRFVAGDRFEAREATAQEITRAVGEGAKIEVDAPETPAAAPENPAPTAEAGESTSL